MGEFSLILVQEEMKNDDRFNETPKKESDREVHSPCINTHGFDHHIAGWCANWV
jgi:hypothetical protein